MEIAKIIGIAFVGALVVIYLKSSKPELAFAASVVTGIILLIFAVDALATLTDYISVFTEKTKLDASLIKLVLKIVGIGYLIEFSAGVIEDFGSKNIADKLVFAGKILIVIISLPILEKVLQLILSLLESV